MNSRLKIGGRHCILVIAVATAGMLNGCATPRDIEPFGYACTHGLTFQARLYKDMVALDGARGHDLLPRLKDGSDGSFQFGNERVQAAFGLGLDKRLATLRYVDIPQTIHCERASVRFGQAPANGASAPSAPQTPLSVSTVGGPRPKLPPEPPDPKDVVHTNIRFGGGPGYN